MVLYNQDNQLAKSIFDIRGTLGRTMTKTHWGLLFALLIIVWLSVSLVRVENQRYAMLIGMCEDKVLLAATKQTSWDHTCLKTVETRTSWIWHLTYALGIK